MTDGRKKTVNGVHRTLLLTKDQDERLERLLAATGMNRNAFFRLCVERLSPRDVADLRARR